MGTRTAYCVNHRHLLPCFLLLPRPSRLGSFDSDYTQLSFYLMHSFPSQSPQAIFFLKTLILVGLISPAFALDPIDWVNTNYIAQQAGVNSPSTRNAQDGIIQSAHSSAKKGPWSITNTGVSPPSGDAHDYLSWAPYHWPDCNWCPSHGGNVHLVHDSNGSSNTSNPVPSSSNDPSSPPADDGDNENYSDEEIKSAAARMVKKRRATSDVSGADINKQELFSLLPTLPFPVAPTPTTDAAVAGTDVPAQQAAVKSKSPSCTPSPTKSLAPSATWTTCPYVVRDGKVNPDVRTLHGPSAINDCAQSVWYNALCFALRKTPVCSQDAARFVDEFFLNPDKKMNPNMAFGQIVRGPGPSGKQGTFTGVLDLRGLVKLANAVKILKLTNSSDWTTERDQGLQDWMKAYSAWITTSAIGKKTRSAPNNHGSFYYAQLVAVTILQGDDALARQYLQEYFSGPFRNQIAASGEQPMEAARTRPFHYRCFNLEAMIALAKMGDQQGIDFWSAKSRYQANIQNAVDFVMKQDPKGEDVTELAPHVAAVMAAYGDSSGKYLAFLKKAVPNYQMKYFWFSDQPEALANTRQKRQQNDADGQSADSIPFVCPWNAIPNGIESVELEDGLFKSCDELKLLFEIP
ncbi:unnamed protein product [Mycena citricolor]|uniref:Alginate lyase domain-containing protein n=1 Tax=Mycena citricolor TaxID=2018698 RepID=A0AAD2HPZ5_9AGAR|nr:unnamed protein product [Mycena citricolor]